MVAIITNLKFILPALLVLNTLSLFIFKNPLRFAKGPFILFAFFLITCLVYRFFIYPKVDQRIQTSQYQEIEKQGWEYINDPDLDNSFHKKSQENKIIRLVLYRFIGLQAAFSFIFVTIGLFISADKKIYASLAFAFFILSFLFLS